MLLEHRLGCRKRRGGFSESEITNHLKELVLYRVRYQDLAPFDDIDKQSAAYYYIIELAFSKTYRTGDSVLDLSKEPINSAPSSRDLG